MAAGGSEASLAAGVGRHRLERRGRDGRRQTSRLLYGGLRKYWVTVMADSNAAAATVLSEAKLISPVSKLSRNRGTREPARSRGERALLWT